jgi:D-3-phosphoglycerate dehydrogenase
MSKLKVVITDYIEPDLEWEEQQFAEMGVDFEHAQLKFGSPQEIATFAADADIVVVNMAKISREVIEHLDRTRLVIRHGVGYDNVDVEAATAHGIVVANVPDYCVDEVAEQAVTLIMACQRKLLTQSRVLKASVENGEWQFDPIYPVYSLRGKTLGFIGCGRIGSTVYRMMQGFGMDVLVHDPYLSERRRRELTCDFVSLERLLRESDVITIHAPLNEETYHYIDDPEFELMKPTAILVNTARGGIVNLDALDRALRAGKLAHAGIDVYEVEPPPPDMPLLNNEKAICTPHLAWLSEESGWKIRQKIVEDVRRFASGQGPRFPLNPEVEISFDTVTSAEPGE